MSTIYLSPNQQATADQKAEQDDKGIVLGFSNFYEVLLPAGESQKALHEAVAGKYTEGVLWFKRTPYPHYRLPVRGRRKMIEAGAVELTSEEYEALTNG